MMVFAEDIADMMAKRRTVEEIRKAKHISPFHCKYNDDDYASACYELRKAEYEVVAYQGRVF